MKKTLYAAALAAALSAGTGLAGATTTVILDDFSVDQGPVQDLSVDGLAVVDLIPGVRSISTNLSARQGGVFNAVEVAEGLLEVANGAGENSEVRITYDLTSDLVPVNATNIVFTYGIARADANLITIRFLLNDQEIAKSLVPANSENLELDFVSTVPVLKNDRFEMVLAGAAGWDVALDRVAVSYDPAPVPEPETVGMLGLGLAALGLWSRRRPV